jgi:hypothetical protein
MATQDHLEPSAEFVDCLVVDEQVRPQLDPLAGALHHLEIAGVADRISRAGQDSNLRPED